MKDPLEHWEFRGSLSFSLFHYDLRNRRCPGDELFRIARQQNKRKSKRAINFSRDCAMANGNNVHLQQLNHDAVGKRNVPPRLCGSIENIKRHYDAEVNNKNHHTCVVCGEPTHSRCSVCNASLHCLPWKGSNNKKKCF